MDGKTETMREEEEYVELSLECFRCNPIMDRDSWAEYMPWLHHWYARLLWAEAVGTVLRRSLRTERIESNKVTEELSK